MLVFSWEGFERIEADDNQANTIAFLRKDKKGNPLVVVCNFSPVDRTGYTIGVPAAGTYTCLFSTDDPAFGGAGRGDQAPVKSQYNPCHGKEQSITLALPPMSAAIYKCTRKFPPRRKKAEAAPKAEKAAKGTKSKKTALAAKGSKKLPAKAEKAPLPKKAEKAPLPRKAEKAPLPRKAEKAPVPAKAEKPAKSPKKA